MTDTTPDHWWDRAACRDVDPELFFPIGDGEPAARQASVAKQVCNRCPVRTACRDFALAHRELTGVWGGMTTEERRSELARRHRDERSEPVAASVNGGPRP